MRCKNLKILIPYIGTGIYINILKNYSNKKNIKKKNSLILYF